MFHKTYTIWLTNDRTAEYLRVNKIIRTYSCFFYRCFTIKNVFTSVYSLEIICMFFFGVVVDFSKAKNLFYDVVKLNLIHIFLHVLAYFRSNAYYTYGMYVLRDYF